MSKRQRSGRVERGHPVGPAGRAEAVGRHRNAVAPAPQAEPRPAPEWHPRTVLPVAVVTGLLALAAYLVTVQRSLASGDSGDLVSAAYVLGVPHPPGYPLFTMLTHVGTLLPVGSPALGANLLTAVMDALCVTVVALLIYRLVTVASQRARANPPLALTGAVVGALLLAFSTAFWLYSLGAEVFALNNLLAALLLLVAVEWAARPRARLLALEGLLFGLGLTNQLTIVLIAPALMILVIAGLWRQLRSSARDHSRGLGLATREILVAGLMVVGGLVPYVYLPIAAAGDPPVNWGDPRTLDRFWAVVARSDYGSLSLSLGVKPGSVPEQLAVLGGDLLGGFVVVGVILAAIGLAWLMMRDRWVAGALLLAFVVSGPFFVAYANPDFSEPVTRGILQRFYILPAIPLAISAGAGAFAVLEAIASRTSRRIALAAVVVCLLFPAGSAAAHGPDVDQSRNGVVQAYAEDLLQTLKPGAVLLMRGDENYTSVNYAQFVEGLRTDVAAMDVELLKQPTYVELMRRLHPAVTIPWSAYREGPPASLAQLVSANIAAHPVYYVGQMKETDWTSSFDEVHAGLVRQIVPKGQGGDGYDLLRAQPHAYAALRYPDHAYPDTTWESIVCEHYGVAAFDLAYALQSAQPVGDPVLTETMYRAAIRLAPDTTVPNAYKNLGVLLDGRKGDPKEIVALWQHFLRLSPDDPDASAIRARVAALGGSSP